MLEKTVRFFGENANHFLWLASGMVLWFVVQNLILPDEWAIWLARRRNFPVAVLPVGIVLLVIASVPLVYAFLWSFIQAFGLVRIERWVWTILAVGVAITAVCLMVVRWLNRDNRGIEED